ncbi:MAG: sigma-54-dependent Fis family transcriptional regulator [Deltaproteobacteria bacterium]|nr:sigma-54-dependent Fis family transcriptional regulator [Deltaproteobacteria bacterium]
MKDGMSILVVDDKKDLARGVALVLGELGSDITVTHSAEEALAAMEESPTDLVLSDMKMPGKDGLFLLDTVRERWPRTRVILFTAFATIESAVDAMKRGACDYLTKPFNNDELLLVVRRALKAIQDEDEIARLRVELRATRGFQGIYARDRQMAPVIESIRRLAPSNATVLIAGESGTGKELVACAIHAESMRASGPFVAFNAAALPESLVESELFGSRKGAFTGADRDRKGLFLEAHGGTLFIDEIASMPLSLQGKLLRALQEREVLPVGSASPVQVDVRIVSATNLDLRRMVREGKFRNDLYYRVSVMRIHLPPLRERIEDIPLLASLFLERMAPHGSVPKRLSSRALRLLISHDWPGNVRELQNVIERAALMARGEDIGPADIVLEDDDLGWHPEEIEGLAYEEAKRRTLERFQRRYVEQIVAQCDGNLSAAARMAGITRAALHRIVKRLGIAAHDDDALRGDGRGDGLEDKTEET